MAGKVAVPKGAKLTPQEKAVQTVLDGFVGKTLTPEVIVELRAALAALLPKRMKRDPNDKSTRAPSAYMLFSKAKRAEIKAAHPDADFAEMGRLIGAAWEEAKKSGEDAPFNTQAAELKAEHDAASGNESDGSSKKPKKTGLDAKTVPELREMLKAAKLDHKGNKPVLIERLRAAGIGGEEKSAEKPAEKPVEVEKPEPVEAKPKKERKSKKAPVVEKVEEEEAAEEPSKEPKYTREQLDALKLEALKELAKKEGIDKKTKKSIIEALLLK